jgi:hypothetical protein
MRLTRVSLAGRVAAAAAAVAVGLLALTGCTESAADRTADSPADHAEDFWAALRVDGDEVEPFVPIAEMTKSADSVVLATFGRTLPPRVLGGTEGDSVTYAVTELKIKSVLAGRQLPETVTIEFLAPGTEVAAALTPPGGEILVFLHEKRGKGEAGLYRAVNSKGLWATTGRSVLDTPLAEEPPTGDQRYVKDISTLNQVGQLADVVRTGNPK